MKLGYLMDKNIDFNSIKIHGDELKNIKKVLKNKNLSGDGEFTKKCQLLLENLTGSKKALLTHSCTAALEMAAILCDLKPGDEVIMPSFTFVSTANAVVLRGAIPVFIDIDSETLNLNINLIQAAITKRTKAIFVVHYAGVVSNMHNLQKICRENNLILVEDAAQALGSKYKGEPAGSFGDLATFSFHETKNIISGEGGALTINRPNLIERAEVIWQKGTDRNKFLRGDIDKYTWQDIGSSFLPSELIAAFLYGQLKNIELLQKKRLKSYQFYEKGFSNITSNNTFRIPKIPNECIHNAHIFYLLLPTQSDRDAFITHMKSQNITAPFHYIPLHSSPAGAKFGRVSGEMRVTNNIANTLVRLPLFNDIDESYSLNKVIEIAKNYLQNY